MKRLLLAVFLLAGCVAPVGAQSCAITAGFAQMPSGRQVSVEGTGFADNDQVVITGSVPYGPLDVHLAANADGVFNLQLRADADGTYVIGPANGLACVAPAVILTSPAEQSPSPSPMVTVPPTPNITLPPTDTE